MIPLPSDFLLSAKEFAGNDYEKFIASLNEPSPISIRSNPFKYYQSFEHEEQIPWSEKGKYLNQRPSFTLDPLFHSGCYYVQDASSQFLEVPFFQAKRSLNRQIRVLDLCAAPGGKSTHILSMLNADDLLVSNEIIPSRNNILRQNIMKWGCANVIVTQNDASQLAEIKNLFDIIVVDAPCSGEGLFRKDNGAIGEWSIDNVNRCAVRQNEILSYVISMLKPDGFLIYSTCTFERKENDDQVSRLAANYDMSVIPIDYSSDEIVKTLHGLSFYPHRIRGEGFYISLLQKNSNENPASIKNPKSKEDLPNSYFEYLKDGKEFTIIKKDEKIFALPSTHYNIFNFLKNNLYIRLAGIFLGELKGKDFIPSEALALSKHMSDIYPVCNVTREKAIEFLKGNPIEIDSSNGFVLINYENHNLGWVKKIGNRVNNYYPKEWRIRMK